MQKPPLFFIIASPFVMFKTDMDIAILSNIIYLAVLFYATYGIGKALFNYQVGLLSSFLVGMFPGIFALSRSFQIEVALTAIVALTFYLFVLNRFQSIKFSFIVGIIMGMGLLTKEPYSIYLFPILLYFFLQPENRKDWKRMIGLLFSITISLILAWLWYSYPGKVGFKTLYYVIFQCRDNHDPLFYLKSLFFHQLFPIFFGLFIISLLYFIIKKKFFLPAMIIVLISIFSLANNKEYRFILPTLPYFAVMIASSVASMQKLKRFAIMALVILSFVQFFTICYAGSLSSLSVDPLLRKYLSNNFHPENGLYSVSVDKYKNNFDQSIGKLIGAISDNSTKTNTPVLFISDSSYICPDIVYSALLRHFPAYVFDSKQDKDISNISDSELDALCRWEIDIAEFVLIEELNKGDAFLFKQTLLLDHLFKERLKEFAPLEAVVIQHDQRFNYDKRFYFYKKIHSL
ncbi:MAG: glycosyltransferase family 39 protein [Candidatus Omnitrophica bacterium]|nr:glycosyltransferase family 39 protein [Candidatus Omnitrophota bacterium]